MTASRMLEVHPDSEYNKLMLSEHDLYYKNSGVDFHINYQAVDRKLEWKEPTTPRGIFEEIIKYIPVNKDWVFLDCGCGLGHVVYLASFYFNIVYGVECIEEVAEIAKKNIKILLPNRKYCTVLFSDIFKLDKKIINKTNVFYISSPFIDENIFEKFVKIILHSLKNKKREIWLIYFYPYCDHIMKKYSNTLPLVYTLKTLGDVNYYHYELMNKNT